MAAAGRFFTSLLGSAGLLGGLFAAGCAKPSNPGFDHDLVLVSVDALRADRLPLYGASRDTGGDPSQPWSLPWLARRGTTWENAWAPAGKTVPSLATFWTGLPPLEHGAVSNNTPLNPSVPTRAESLHALGFTTLARVANRSLAPVIGLARGFDQYGLRFKEQEPRVGSDLLDLASDPIRTGKPLLLWAHFMAPHQPYTPVPPNDRRYASGEGPAGDNETLYSLNRDPSKATPEVVGHLRGLYDGEVRTAAGYVQKLLSGLDALYRKAGRGGLLDNAVVVFFSDHGEELADHNAYFMHAKSLYSGVIRVPLVMAGPGIPAGARRKDPIRMADILPFVLEGEDPRPGPFFATWKGKFYTVREGSWTLIHNPCADRDGPREPPRDGRFPYPEVALFDRSRDPFEQRDVSRENPEVTRRLLGALHDWYGSLHFREPGPIPGLDPERRAELEELGYLGEDMENNACVPWPAERWK